VRKHGVTMQAEAVARGEHTLCMIVEAAHEPLVRNYMAPFAMAGSVDVYPTCAGVVSRGGCDAALPPTDTFSTTCSRKATNSSLVWRAAVLPCTFPVLVSSAAYRESVPCR
jgi:hypothetical protein